MCRQAAVYNGLCCIRVVTGIACRLNVEMIVFYNWNHLLCYVSRISQMTPVNLALCWFELSHLVIELRYSKAIIVGCGVSKMVQVLNAYHQTRHSGFDFID